MNKNHCVNFYVSWLSEQFKNKNYQMKKRLLKVVSVPIFFALAIPMLIIQSIIWIIVGKKNPTELIVDYFDWLDEW